MSSLRLGLLSDLHRTTDSRCRDRFHNEYDFAGHLARVERALAWFAERKVDALILCGDLTHTAGEQAMAAVLGECALQLPAPTIVVSGNHDASMGEDLLSAAVAHLGSDRVVLGAPRGEMIGAIRVAGVHVAPSFTDSRSRLQAMPAVRDWGAEPVVLVSHLPILSRAGAVAARGMPYPGDLIDREPAAALLSARRAATVVVSGHIHVRDASAEGPVLQLLQAAMIESPFEAATLDVLAEPDGRVLVTRQSHRTSDKQFDYEPTLAGSSGSWRYIEGRWKAAEACADASQDGTVVADQVASAR